MKRIALIVLLLTMAGSHLNAQSPGTSLIFPQLADGRMNDGTVYQSTINIINPGPQNATCTLRPSSNLSSHLSGPLTFTVANHGGMVSIPTVSKQGNFLQLAAGYAVLSCDQPVAGGAAYMHASSSGTVLGGTAVFPSPLTTMAEFPAVYTSDFRTAIAIANDTDSPAQYQVTIVDASGQITSGLTVPARANVAMFLDQLATLPANFNGAVFIQSATPFSTVSLVFSGSVFWSQVAVNFNQPPSTQ